MYSLKSLYKIGYGPSSSHTMGPANACQYILNKYKDNISSVDVTFYGSLAATGKGHLTDYIAKLTLKDVKNTIHFDKIHKVNHPNTMIFKVIDKDGKEHSETIISVGGGIIEIEGEKESSLYEDVYPLHTFKTISDYCSKNQLSLIEFIHKYEGNDIDEYVSMVYDHMIKVVDDGLEKEGPLPGKLNVMRKAKTIYHHINADENAVTKEKRLVMAYAFAAAEENASGALIVTAPTCGSCGIIPALAKYLGQSYSKEKIIEALEVAGLMGLIVKTNASISGAECGCQAEIGTASSMGAAMVTYLNNGTIDQIGRASEIALEHSLGLTCDPVQGYVQVPCIERNALYALRALEAASLAIFIDSSMNKISFDDVVKTMYQTGLDLQKGYRETAKSGLAKIYRK